MIVLDPSQKIPAAYRSEWAEDNFRTLQKRLRIMSLATIFTFIGLHVVHYWLIEPTQFGERFFRAGSLTVIMLLVLYLAARAKDIIQAKTVGYLATLLILSFFMYLSLSTMLQGVYYAYSEILLISIFFFSLMLPWKLPDLGVILLIHLAANSIYFWISDLWDISLLVEYPKQALIWDNTFTLFVAAIFCTAVRYQENTRQVKNFLLLKEIETQKNKIESLNQQMTEELELAARVHRTLIPRNFENDHLGISLTYLPMSQVGGDYANFHFVDSQKMVFLISDVTGHGVPAALLVNRLDSEFQTLARKYSNPGALLSEMDVFIAEKFAGTHMYLTAFCGFLDLSNLHFQYSGYGHPSQFLCREQEKEILPLESQTSLLGLQMEKESGYFLSEQSIEPGDRLVLFTDGVIEVANAAKELFGSQRLKEWIQEKKDLSGVDFHRQLIEELSLYRRSSFQDDIFLVSIDIKSPGP